MSTEKKTYCRKKTVHTAYYKENSVILWGAQLVIIRLCLHIMAHMLDIMSSTC